MERAAVTAVRGRGVIATIACDSGSGVFFTVCG